MDQKKQLMEGMLLVFQKRGEDVMIPNQILISIHFQKTVIELK